MNTYDPAMGLIDDFGYRSQPPGLARAWLLNLASTKPMTAVLLRTLTPLDRLTLRLSGGRTSFSGLIGGQPVLWLTVTGRKSGKPHSVPLNGIPQDDDLAVIGSYFGSPAHPAWALNLEANPDVQVMYEGRTLPARARRAAPHEEADIWRTASVIYPGYDRYRERVSREIKVFLLESG
jgi:deazaflavin-dependent oxidoreductase (nitroreductase family)